MCSQSKLYVPSFIVVISQQVAAYSSVNKMTTKNLAIVFGPNLMWSKSNAGLTSLGYVNMCADFMVLSFDEIFVK